VSGRGQTARDRRVEIGCEFASRRSGRGRQSTNHQPRAGRQYGKSVDAEVLKLSAHPIAHYCAANLAPDHKTGPRPGERTGVGEGNGVGEGKVDDKPRTSCPPTRPHGGGEVRALAQPGRGRKHGIRDSGRRQAERP
jgi:hypothetical protein